MKKIFDTYIIYLFICLGLFAFGCTQEKSSTRTKEDEKLMSEIDQVFKRVGAHEKLEKGLLPASIQEEMILYYGKSLKDVPSSVIIKAAETAHDPKKGIIKGLDLFEIETIREVDSKRAFEYDKMINSSINEKNLLVDELPVAKNFLNSAIAYDKAIRRKGSKFTRFFMSEETISMRELEEKSAEKKFKEAEKQYLLQKENVVSYKTIQQWDFKEHKPR